MIIAVERLEAKVWAAVFRLNAKMGQSQLRHSDDESLVQAEFTARGGASFLITVTAAEQGVTLNLQRQPGGGMRHATQPSLAQVLDLLPGFVAALTEEDEVTAPLRKEQAAPARARSNFIWLLVAAALLVLLLKGF